MSNKSHPVDVLTEMIENSGGNVDMERMNQVGELMDSPSSSVRIDLNNLASKGYSYCAINYNEHKRKAN